MKRKMMIILLLLPNAMNTFACQEHEGFGFGSFGQFHPLAKQHMNYAEPRKLKITHDSQLNVSSATYSQLILNYVVPSDYTNAKVTITASEYLIIEDSAPLNLNNSIGMIDVMFQATAPGEHFIVVRVDATQSNEPYSKIQQISVTAI